MPGNRARILVLHPVLSVLDYRVPHGMTVEPGSIVVVSNGPRTII
jgi:primosomal protein N' (replication factor Y)